MKSSKYRVEFNLYNGHGYDNAATFGAIFSGDDGEREVLLKLRNFIDDRIDELEIDSRDEFDKLFGDEDDVEI